MKQEFKKTISSGCAFIPIIAAWILPIMKGDIISFAAMYFATVIFLCGILIRLVFEMIPPFLLCCTYLLIVSYGSFVLWKDNVFIPNVVDILIESLENMANKINKLIEKLKSIKRR